MSDRGRSDCFETRLVGEKEPVCYDTHFPSTCVQRGGVVERPRGVEQKDGGLVQGQVPDGYVLVWLGGLLLYLHVSACSSPSPSQVLDSADDIILLIHMCCDII